MVFLLVTGVGAAIILSLLESNRRSSCSPEPAVFVHTTPYQLLVHGLPSIQLVEEYQTSPPASTYKFRSACQAKGSTVGKNVGKFVGVSVGKDVGAELGAAVGKKLGVDDGKLVGSRVGIPVGRIVGSVVGSRVGKFVGCSEGHEEGSSVG